MALALAAWLAPVTAQETDELTPEAINAADLSTLSEIGSGGGKPLAAIVRLQVLLDRTAASPGVIDGFDGENVRKAVFAFEIMQGLPADGRAIAYG